MEWVTAFAAAASALAAVLAWIAKILWSREYAFAKDETIKAKDAQIQLLEREILSLKEMTPMKIREYFLSVREQLEEYNENLKNDLKKAHESIAKRDQELESLRKVGGDQAEKMKKLQSERDNLETATKRLESNLREYTKMLTNVAHTTFGPLLLLEPETFDNVNDSWKSLRNYIVHEDKEKLAKWIEKNFLKTYFALSHELGHIVLQDRLVDEIGKNGEKPKGES